MTDKTEEKELTQEEIAALKSIGKIAQNWYAITYNVNSMPYALFQNEEHARTYRDKFSATSIIEPYPMVIKDYTKPRIPSLIVSDQEKEPTCGDCGKELTLVRPGKHQCDNAECVQNKPYTFSENHEKAVKQLLRVSVSEDGTIKINESDIRQLPFVKSLQTQIQELQREIDDNRKVIASNGMTIGELRKEVERLEKYIADHFNHVA